MASADTVVLCDSRLQPTGVTRNLDVYRYVYLSTYPSIYLSIYLSLSIYIYCMYISGPWNHAVFGRHGRSLRFGLQPTDAYSIYIYIYV